MKTISTITLIIGFLFITKTNAQTDSTTVDPNNLLDLQSKTLTSILGEDLDGESAKKPIGYLELLEKSDLSAEQKEEYKNLYYLQAKELTQKQKDSLSNALLKKMQDAKIDD